MFVVVVFSSLVLKIYDVVEMIKQFPEHVYCFSLSVHGGNVFIGSYRSVRQWNVVTDNVVPLEEYSGLN